MALTCRYFGISRQYVLPLATALRPAPAEHTRRPWPQAETCSQPTWLPEVAQAVSALGVVNPRWGKDKLAPLLQAEGWDVSASMVGRILTHLKASGQLHEGRRPGVTVLRKRMVRPSSNASPRSTALRRRATWGSWTPWTCAHCQGLYPHGGL